MASLLGVRAPSGKVEVITKENQGGELKYEAKVDKKIILNSKTVMMYRKKVYNVKSEPKILEENTKKVKVESIFVKDSVSINKVVESYPLSVKPTGVRKVDSKPAQCDICSKTLANKYILKAHMNSPRGCSPREAISPKTFVTCATCGEDKKAKRILKHERFCRMSEDERAAYNETKKVECEKCHKILSHRHKLVRHIKTVHTESKQFQCEHCEHRDNRSDNMKTHIKNNHSKVLPS